MASLSVEQGRRIVEDHAHVTLVRDGKLFALVGWSKRENGELVTGVDEERVPLRSVSALREWLGY